MKKLFRNSLIASVVAVAGAFSGANNAMAFDSDPIEFNGTVPTVCTFGTPTSGTLAAGTSSGKARLVSHLGGENATISLSCNGGATIAVKELQEVATNGMTRQTGSGTSFFNVRVQDSSSGFVDLNEDGSKEGDITKASAFSETLTVLMDIRYEETALNPGTYTYRTVITATPQ